MGFQQLSAAVEATSAPDTAQTPLIPACRVQLPPLAPTAWKRRSCHCLALSGRGTSFRMTRAAWTPPAAMLPPLSAQWTAK